MQSPSASSSDDLEAQNEAHAAVAETSAELAARETLPTDAPDAPDAPNAPDAPDAEPMPAPAGEAAAADAVDEPPVAADEPEATEVLAEDPEPTEVPADEPPPDDVNEVDESSHVAAAAAPTMPTVPSLAELEAEVPDRAVELEEARLIAHVQEMCVARGTFVFTRPSVLCSAFGLEEDMSPHRAGRWALRRILIPAASLERAPGPADESEAKSFLTDVHAVAWSTLTSTASVGTSVVGAAVNWGSWLLRPAQYVVQSGTEYLVAGVTAISNASLTRTAAITDGSAASGAPSQPAVAAASAAGGGAKDDASSARLSAAGASSAGPSQHQLPPDTDSVISFGMGEFTAVAAAIDEACRSVFDSPADGDRSVVFRPALHRIAARVVNHLIERAKAGGALARVVTWDEWTQFLLVEENVTHVAEMTNFLTNHAQVVRPVECPLGRGLFLAAQLSEAAESLLWPVDVANALLSHKLRAELLDKCVPQWEDRLNDLTTSGDAENTDVGRARAAELRDLIAANKLFQIEMHKTLARALRVGELAPKASLSAIEARLEHFGDVSVYPMTSPADAKAALMGDAAAPASR